MFSFIFFGLQFLRFSSRYFSSSSSCQVLEACCFSTGYSLCNPFVAAPMRHFSKLKTVIPTYFWIDDQQHFLTRISRNPLFLRDAHWTCSQLQSSSPRSLYSHLHHSLNEPTTASCVPYVHCQPHSDQSIQQPASCIRLAGVSNQSCWSRRCAKARSPVLRKDCFVIDRVCPWFIYQIMKLLIFIFRVI